MAITNDFLPFATGGSANVVTQAAYLALPAVSTGYEAGLAQSNQVNKTLRQSTFVAAAVMQYVGNTLNINTPDDGNFGNAVTNITNAIAASVRGIGRNVTALTAAGSPYTLTASQAGFVTIDPTGGPVVVNLPTAASAPNKTWTFLRIGSGTNTVTLQTQGADTFGFGGTSMTLASAFEVADLEPDGTSLWHQLNAVKNYTGTVKLKTAQNTIGVMAGANAYLGANLDITSAGVFNRQNTGAPVAALQITNGGAANLLTAAAGANPISWVSNALLTAQSFNSQVSTWTDGVGTTSALFVAQPNGTVMIYGRSQSAVVMTPSGGAGTVPGWILSLPTNSVYPGGIPNYNVMLLTVTHAGRGALLVPWFDFPGAQSGNEISWFMYSPTGSSSSPGDVNSPLFYWTAIFGPNALVPGN